jgi:hypothetical protein
MDLDPGGLKTGGSGSGSGSPTLPERRNWKLVIGRGFTFVLSWGKTCWRFRNINVDLLQKKIQNLEQDNRKLHAEASKVGNIFTVGAESLCRCR